MPFHDKAASKAIASGKGADYFRAAAQKHANVTWFLLIAAGAIWYFIGWGWALIPVAIGNPVESTEWNPVQRGTSIQKLKAGEIVPVDIALYPSSTFFAAGETLQLIIAANEIVPSPPYRKSADCNHGKHVLHFGGRYDSYLLVPKIPL
jgi:hypothetical protein